MRLPRPRFPDALKSRAPLRVWLAALGAALVIPALTALASLSFSAFDCAGHWTADWRTALAVAPPPGQHETLALVLVNEDTLERFNAPARSPVDRRLLAQLVRTIDGAHPRAIGLDFIFDMKTADDDGLIEAVRSATAPVVIGISAPPAKLTPSQETFQEAFWKQTGRPAGYVNVATDADGAVRRQGEPNPPQDAGFSFAERLAQAAGKPVEHQSRRIVWRNDPHGPEAFLTIPAHFLLPGLNAREDLRTRQLASLKDRVVILGLDLNDQRDRHLTPLSKVTGEDMTGALIQTHLTAQIWDGRSYRELGGGWRFAFGAALALAGFALGYGHFKKSWLLGLLPPAAYLLADVVAFAWLGLVLPFAATALAWGAGVSLGSLMSALERWGVFSQTK
jgi:adenylate cyclase